MSQLSHTTGTTYIFQVPFADIRHLRINFDLFIYIQPYAVAHIIDSYYVVYKMIADQEQPCSSTAAQDRVMQSPALCRTPTETVTDHRTSESVQHRER